MTDTTPTLNEAAGKLFNKAVCLLVEFDRLGVTRKIATSAVDTHGAKPSMIHVSQDILNSPKLDAIVTFDGKLRAYIRRRSTPNPIIRGGLYMLGYDLLPEVDATLTAKVPERKALVAAFLAVYEAEKAKAQIDLGPLFDPTKYPPVDRIAQEFDLRWHYLTIGTPDSLQTISADIFQREAEKAAAQWTDALQVANDVLLVSFADLVSHMVERLQPNDDGKPKVFRNSLVNNLTEFLQTFDARNIGGHAELAAEVAKARDLLSGIDAEHLRKNDGLKTAVSAGFAEIKARLDTMITARPVRKFSADDEA